MPTTPFATHYRGLAAAVVVLIGVAGVVPRSEPPRHARDYGNRLPSHRDARMVTAAPPRFARRSA
jgi:hypothetical protein